MSITGTPPAGGAGAPALGARVLHFLAESRPLFHYGRLPSYWGTMRRLSRTLDLQVGERLLDVGCGTGVGTRLARGFYVGLDTDFDNLRFAHDHAERASCSFVRMSALRLGFAAQAFDKAVLINMVHHLDEDVLDRLLDQLCRVVRKRVVVLDVAPDTTNALSRFLLGHDRGDYIRERADLRTALQRYFDIDGEEVFHNLLHTIPQVMFTLAPRAPNRRLEGISGARSPMTHSIDPSMNASGASRPSEDAGAAMLPEDAQRLHYDRLAPAYAEHYEDEGSLLYRQRFFDGPMLQDVDLEGREVLEAMCGSGQTTGTLLARGAKVTGLDISPASIDSFRTRWPACRTVCAPITHSGLPDASFDAVVVVAGLHHLHPNLDPAMDEIHRILKPGGTFCFIEPHRGSLPDVFRRVWYKFDPLFLANEAAIDVDVLREKNASRFDFVKESYGGSIAYLLVLNSLVFRIPRFLKRLYTPFVLRMEERMSGVLGKRFACSVLGQWKKK